MSMIRKILFHISLHILTGRDTMVLSISGSGFASSGKAGTNNGENLLSSNMALQLIADF
jgi:hypothetical protein